MKKINLAILLSVISISLFAQEDKSIMTIGNKDILKSDFEYLYHKNRASIKGNPYTVDQYIDLYVKFKQKVMDAEALCYDTAASFQKEFKSYRNQIAASYLRDSDMEDKLIKEAYEYLKEDVKMSHILIKLPENATPIDTLEGYNKAMNIIKRLKKEDFAKVAKEVSDDITAKDNGGNVGWFTGQMVTYLLEKEMYSIPLNRISNPILTQYGYHIIKITDRRPAIGKVKVAHILKAYPQNATKEQKESCKNQIYEIYKRLQSGEDFAILAKEKSDDNSTSSIGGVLQWFGVGRMVPNFENTAFSLKNKDDISEPFETEFGWHIIKLIDKKNIGSFEEEKPNIANSFRYDGRSYECKKSFINKLKKDYPVKIYDKSYSEVLDYAKKFDSMDSTFLQEINNFDDIIITINGDRKVLQSGFMEYLYGRTYNNKVAPEKSVQILISEFIDNEVLKYEDSRLEKKYPDFKHLLDEYHDGILLFNISNDMVWERASIDTLGLEKYFNENINDYVWDQPRYKGKIFYSKDKKVAKKVRKAAKKMSDKEILIYIAEINKDSMIIDVQKGLWKHGDHKVIDKLVFKDKKADFTPTEKYPYVFVVGKMQKRLPDSYKDVKSAVVTDYQKILEDRWQEELDKKYPVRINKQVVDTVK